MKINLNRYKKANNYMKQRITPIIMASIVAISSTACSLDGSIDNRSSLTSISNVGNSSIDSVNIGTDDVLSVSNAVNDKNGENEVESEPLTTTQRNSINMLNYITVLTQEINNSKGSRVYLETAYSSLINNIYPNAVDSRTQAQISGLLDTLENYRMISVKRERLEYIYEQNRAQALRSAIPNPLGLLSTVQSGNPLKLAASIIYMAVDSASSYASATSQADMQYLKDGWELDDEEAEELHNSRKSTFSYMISMVRDNSLPGDSALNEESVQNYVEWKNNDNNIRRIVWLETNEKTYKDFGPYWLTLAKSYYDTNEYDKCMEAIQQYEKVTTRIFRKDYDYAQILPLAIISAKELFDKDTYIKLADDYAEKILANTDEDDVILRYYVAQVYLDLCAVSNDNNYLNKSYKIVLDNVNILVDQQKKLNEEYITDIKTIEADKDATKREKNEVKEYNKLLKEERKVALPPIHESLYLNCDMLFALADKIGVSDNEKSRINSVLHGNNESLFLSQALDNKFWFGNKNKEINSDDIDIKYDKDKILIPATCVTNRSKISVRVTNKDGSQTIDDWIVDMY